MRDPRRGRRRPSRRPQLRLPRQRRHRKRRRFLTPPRPARRRGVRRRGAPRRRRHGRRRHPQTPKRVDDKGLLRENLLAAQEGGAEFITLHPRTRAQGYSGRAEWADVAFAVDLLDVPVVGNGDVTSPLRAARLIAETGCAGVMIGRGAVQDPLVFRRVAARVRVAGVRRARGGGAAARGMRSGGDSTGRGGGGGVRVFASVRRRRV